MPSSISVQLEHPFIGDVLMAQMVASMSSVALKEYLNVTLDFETSIHSGDFGSKGKPKLCSRHCLVTKTKKSKTNAEIF